MPYFDPNGVTERPDITGAMEKYDVEQALLGYIANKIYPTLETARASGTFRVVAAKEMNQDVDTKRASDGSYNSVGLGLSEMSFKCEQNGLEGLVDDFNEAVYGKDGWSAEFATAQLVRNSVLLSREKALAAHLFNATTFTGQVTTPANEWDDSANATPIADVQTGKEAIRARTGYAPNVLVLPYYIYQKLRVSDAIKDAIRSGGAGKSSTIRDINLEMLASVFDLDRIIVSGRASMRNSANQGQTASFTDIWDSDFALLARINNEGDTLTTPGLGRNLHYNGNGSQPGGAMETYRDDKRGGNIMRCRLDSQQKDIWLELGQLFNGLKTP